MDDFEESFGRFLGRPRSDDAASHRPGCHRHAGRTDPRDDLAHDGSRQRGESRIAVHAGQRDGRDTEWPYGGDTIRRLDGQADRPHPASEVPTIGTRSSSSASSSEVSWTTACERSGQPL